jgi:hypothetical protein
MRARFAVTACDRAWVRCFGVTVCREAISSFAAHLVTGWPSMSRSSYICPVASVFQVLSARFLAAAMVAWVWQCPC